MTVRIYKHTDAGAPSLTTAAGSFISLLNACLVTGYGSQIPAGWTMPFTGTNTAVFKQPNTSNGMYFKVDDVASVNVRVYGYESMDSLTVGYGRFPTNIQQLDGLYIHKASGSTPVHWFLLANDKTLYLTIYPNNNINYQSGVSGTFMFGDINTEVVGDKFNTMIIGGVGASSERYFFPQVQSSSGLTTTASGHYMARSWTQVGTAIVIKKFSDNTRTNSAGWMGSNGMSFPNPIDGKMHMGKVEISEYGGNIGVIRGSLPGIWNPFHACNGVLSDGDQFTDVPTKPNATFEFRQSGPGSPNGGFLMETSNTW
jgi:hypothetical protein